jgi:hypothetical protein
MPNVYKIEKPANGNHFVLTLNGKPIYSGQERACLIFAIELLTVEENIEESLARQ